MLGAPIAPVALAAHGIVEPAGTILIAQRQECWRAAVEEMRAQ